MQDPLSPSKQRPMGQGNKPAEVAPAPAEVSPRRLGIISRIGESALLLLIRVYQVTLSPFLGGHCRYKPTCSMYALEAIQEHGPWRGGILALKRLLRCHPFVKGGYDPVPPRRRPQ